MKDRDTILAFGLLGLVWAIAWLTRPGGTITISEIFDIPMPAPSDAIRRFAQAVARQEGFYVKGSIPAVRHNPGNLMGSNGIIRTFETDDQGWAALYKQLGLIVSGSSAHYNLDMTINEMAQVWTATQQAEWSRNVANFLGVPESAQLWRVLA